jgi:hypothetical protein
MLNFLSMKRLVAVVLLFVCMPAFARKKDPAVEQRKAAVVEMKKYFEQNDVQVGVYAEGKQSEIVTFFLPDSAVAGMLRFEKTEVEIAKDKLKSLGFKTVRIVGAQAIFSTTFPKGKWEIPLE